MGSRNRGRNPAFAVLAGGRVSADDYGAAEAARLLGLSPRRVRQLVDSGGLEAVSRQPLRVSAVSVLALRATRKEDVQEQENRGEMASAAAVAATLERALSAVESAADRVESVYRERLAIAASTESALRDSLAAAEARATMLQAQLDALETKPPEEPVKAPKSAGKKGKKWKRKGR